jgi:hypothetical protein
MTDRIAAAQKALAAGEAEYRSAIVWEEASAHFPYSTDHKQALRRLAYTANNRAILEACLRQAIAAERLARY